jgi:hypothetical protein
MDASADFDIQILAIAPSVDATVALEEWKSVRLNGR